jgi:hypothetical protein
MREFIKEILIDNFGDNFFGFGTDFYGVDFNHLPLDINEYHELYKISETLKTCGLSDEVLNKIFSYNDIINLQSRLSCVKCLLDGELPRGRRFNHGLTVASRCRIILSFYLLLFGLTGNRRYFYEKKQKITVKNLYCRRVFGNLFPAEFADT